MGSGPGTPFATTPSVSGRGRRVLLVVTGGIAAYKACAVVRRLVDAGCRVRVAMTEAATRFVTPMTFEALSGQPVGTSLWGEGGETPLDHIHWAQDCDLLLVAPATADFLAKMALGRADDLPSTLVLATDAAVMVAPAMNDRMWAHPATRAHLDLLRTRGVAVIAPGSGPLACGTVAEGRLAEPEEVAARVLERLEGGPWRGRRVLVTAGGTREAIDAVRYVGNHSSGRMGMALAEAARDLGADVTLLLGPTEASPPLRVHVERFESTSDLQSALARNAPAADVVLMAAAVSDFRPARAHAGKLKKKDGRLAALELEPTPDLLAELGAQRPAGQLLVGFALESGDDAVVEAEAHRKLQDKGLDLICGNRADVEGEGFAADTNRLYLLDRQGCGEWTPRSGKRALARRIFERLQGLTPRDAAGEARA